MKGKQISRRCVLINFLSYTAKPRRQAHSSCHLHAEDVSTEVISLKSFSRTSEVFCEEKWFLKRCITAIRWRLCCTDLSLRCDPDGQSAIVPPVIDKLSQIVGLLRTGGCIEPHVVDYPVILDVSPCRRGSLSVCLRSLFIA